MADREKPKAVGEISKNSSENSQFLPKVLTRIVWVLWIISAGVLVGRVLSEQAWKIQSFVSITGLTVVMWFFVTLISGIIHSYSRRYMAGSKRISRFYSLIFGFTLIVMTLVAADHIALFSVAWIAMGLVMAELIGYIRDWPQAQKAAMISRRYFLISSTLVVIGLTVLSWETKATTVSGIIKNLDAVSGTPEMVAVGSILLAAMIQSALVPFHNWLLSSMTAPTPASALMHAGFVNAGGILLTFFAPLLNANINYMLLIVIVGGFSALLGKLLKSVQTDAKRKFGCSTVGQMGFMIMQAGLGFFSAAIAHLILHGFYKAYLFLSSSGRVEQTSPEKSEKPSAGVIGIILTVLTALAGGVTFAILTGKGTSILTGEGTSIDSGVLLTLLVVLTTLHATRDLFRNVDLSPIVKPAVVLLVFIPAIVVYSGMFLAISKLIGLPMVTDPTKLTVVHGILAVVFTVAYISIEVDLHQKSKWLYVKLLNFSQPSPNTVLTQKEEYNEY